MEDKSEGEVNWETVLVSFPLRSDAEEWRLDIDKPTILEKFNVDRIFLSLNGDA